MTSAAAEVPADPGTKACDVCTGLSTVFYDRAAEARATPFCLRCGRELELVLVDVPARAALNVTHARDARPSNLEGPAGA